MNKSMTAIVLAAAIAVATTTAWAEDKVADVTDMQALRAAVRADKRALVASTLNLTDAEAKKFWPIYDAYQRDLNMFNQRRNAAVIDLVGLDRPVSDLYAKKLANEVIAADEAEIKALRALHNRMMRALPPKKAARYLQLELKIRALLDYDVASSIPLIK
jgi:Spy/CpxP family protein refolding chaperone